MSQRVSFDFSGKPVIVTGGSRGIGRGIALAFIKPAIKSHMATLAEIAEAVIFLACSAARRVYGQTLIADGASTLFGG